MKLSNSLKSLNILILLSIFSLSSCSENEKLSESSKFENKLVKFNFTNSNDIKGKNYRIENFYALILSVNPLVIDSEDLAVINSINEETQEIVEIIVLKDDIESNDPNVANKELIGTKRGYLYNASIDCFIYGTHRYWDDGTVSFLPAPGPVQAMENICAGDEEAFAKI